MAMLILSNLVLKMLFTNSKQRKQAKLGSHENVYQQCYASKAEAAHIIEDPTSPQK